MQIVTVRKRNSHIVSFNQYPSTRTEPNGTDSVCLLKLQSVDDDDDFSFDISCLFAD